MVRNDDGLEFEFLSDKPLSAGDELDFGHDGLSAAVSRMVSGCKGTLSIGLFGGWGTGKSTIANNVAETLRGNGLPVVFFDVWKHETDTLRAAFIKECYNQLKEAKALKGKYQVPDRLEHDIAESNEQGYSVLKEFAKIAGTALLVAAALACLLAIILLFIGKGDWLKEHLSPIITVSIFGAFIKYASDIVTLFRRAPSYRFRDRMQDPHEFEEEFGKLLKDIREDQILFVFDNLDRVTHSTSINMLSMIKTFLEPSINLKDVTFLIPCDDGAIREHVEHVYLNSKSSNDSSGTSSFRSEEFLRKFFNTVVWIPEFIPSELASYARKCLCATRVKVFDNETLAWFIATSFRENPRQIKQFINTYLSNYILATEREKTGDLPAGFCKKNNKELCLYCLLNTKYPLIVEELRKAKVILLQKTADHQSDQHGDFWLTVERAYNVVPAISNLRPFYSLRLSKSEKALPGVTELLISLADGDIAAAKERAEEVHDVRSKQAEFNEAFRDELDRTVNWISASNLITCMVDLVVQLGIRLDSTSVAAIQNSIFRVVHPSTEVLSPLKLLEAGVLNDVDFADRLVDDWIERTESLLDNLTRKPNDLRAFVTEVFMVIADKPALGKKTRSVQRKLLTQHYLDDLDSLERLLEVPELSPSLVNESVADEYMEQYQSGGLPDDAEARLRYYRIVNQFGADKIGSSAFDQAIEAHVSLLNWLLENAAEKDGFEVWENAFDLLLGLLNMCSKKVSQAEHQPVLVSLAVAVIHAIDSAPDDISEAIAIPTLIVLAEHVNDPEQEQVVTKVDSFFSKCKGADFEVVLQKIGDSSGLIEESLYSESIEDNAIKDEQVFDIVYERGGEEYRINIMRRLIDDDADAALKRISKPDFSIPPTFDVTDYTLKAAAQYSGSSKEPLLRIAARFGCDGNDVKLRTYVEQLKELLKSADVSSQAAGLDLLRESDFLPEHRLYNLSKDVLVWLESPGLTKKAQRHALQAVVLRVDQFNDPEQKKFTQFCWDELIHKSSVSDSLEMGFDALKELGVRYDKVWTNNFESVLQRIEQEETGTKLRKNLIDGLVKLKPDGHLTSTEKKFWKKVQELQGEEPKDA